MADDLQTDARRIMEMAKQRSLTLATAESCTAGALVHLLAEAPGARDTLQGGFVVYSKEHKTAALGVSGELLTRHTAVSRQVAEAMAKGGIERSKADLVVAITGVAGPEPDEDGNPVGFVDVALASRDSKAKVVASARKRAQRGNLQAAVRSGSASLKLISAQRR